MNKRCDLRVVIVLPLLLAGWLPPAFAGAEALQSERDGKAVQKAGKKADVRPAKKLPGAPAKPASTPDDTSKHLGAMQREQHDQARQAIDNLK
ncbi:MAG: hypothetical protein ACM3SV_02255 [Betaproteobacteria bacterium]